jgi:hypothetical protein
MISRFIFRIKSAAWQEIGALGGLTSFRQNGVFGAFRDFCSSKGSFIVVDWLKL